MLAKFFRIAFGAGGDKTAIPDATQVSGAVSYNQGYSPQYELPYSDPNARDIERPQNNQLHYDITTALQEYQTNGVPDWIDPSQNNATNYPYPKFARVRYTDGKVYVSQKAANTSLPTVAADWFEETGRLLRILRYRLVAGVQNVSINGGADTPTGASTYVPSGAMKFAIAEVQGAGSAGAGCTKPSAGNLSAGAPGVSGSYAKAYLTLASIGASQVVTVGAKGVGVLGATGSAGGSSSVGSLVTAPGGPTGATFQNSFAVASQYFGNGNVATAPTGGNLLSLVGASGLPTTILNGGIGNGTQGGVGGYTPFGIATAGTAINTLIPAATYYGQGGYGAVITSAYAPASIAGGDGGDGIVIITEYA